MTLPGPQTRTRIRWCLGLCFALIGVASCAPEGRLAGAPRITLTPCHLSAHGTTSRIAALCGTTTVPEDWDSPSGPTISLRVAVVKATSRQPAADPLFLFAGGPGHAATESYVPVARALEGIRKHRDIVLINQRGTGGSHPLRCEGALPLDDPRPEEQLTRIAECARTLGPRAAHYTTRAAVRDFDEVRARLGYERINIYGTSYGTRVALTYLREYPQRVRSLILDGVVPQDAVLGPAELAWAPLRAKEAILSRCSRDPACRERFPKLAEEFAALEREIQAGPTLTVPHPRTGAPTKVTLSLSRYSLMLRLLAYSGETLGILPHIVHAAHEHKDLTRIASLALFIEDLLAHTIGTVLEYTVLCSEDWPFFTREMAEALKGPHGRTEIDQLAKICAVWPHKPVSPDFKKPVESDVPALLLSGEFDPVTPPSAADRAQGAEGGAPSASEAGAPSRASSGTRRHLTRSMHIVVPGQGHGVLPRGCVPDIATRFVEEASVERLDSSCVRTVRPFPLFLDPLGPLP